MEVLQHCSQFLKATYRKTAPFHKASGSYVCFSALSHAFFSHQIFLFSPSKKIHFSHLQWEFFDQTFYLYTNFFYHAIDTNLLFVCLFLVIIAIFKYIYVFMGLWFTGYRTDMYYVSA